MHAQLVGSQHGVRGCESIAIAMGGYGGLRRELACRPDPTAGVLSRKIVCTAGGVNVYIFRARVPGRGTGTDLDELKADSPSDVLFALQLPIARRRR